MREASKLLAGISANSGIALVPASAAGGWKYQVIFATQFQQIYLGYAKHDDRVYGKKWLALRARLYALLGSAKPLTISAGKDSYQLPAIDAANWRAPFEGCGLGASW
jgi:hypothetical protein